MFNNLIVDEKLQKINEIFEKILPFIEQEFDELSKEVFYGDLSTTTLFKLNYTKFSSRLFLRCFNEQKIAQKIAQKHISELKYLCSTLEKITGECGIYEDLTKNVVEIFGEGRNPRKKFLRLSRYFRSRGYRFLFNKKAYRNKYIRKARAIFNNIRKFIIHLIAKKYTRTITTSSVYSFEEKRVVNQKVTVNSYSLTSTYNAHKFKQDKEKMRKEGKLIYWHGGRGTCLYMDSETFIKFASKMIHKLHDSWENEKIGENERVYNSSINTTNTKIPKSSEFLTKNADFLLKIHAKIAKFKQNFKSVIERIKMPLHMEKTVLKVAGIVEENVYFMTKNAEILRKYKSGVEKIMKIYGKTPYPFSIIYIMFPEILNTLHSPQKVHLLRVLNSLVSLSNHI